MFSHKVEHGSQVHHVNEEEAPLICHAKDDIEDAFLGFIEAQESGQENWPHFRNGHPNRNPLFARHIPELDWIAGWLIGCIVGRFQTFC